MPSEGDAIRTEIRDLLEATGAFDSVHERGVRPDVPGTRLCELDPTRESHAIDADFGGAIVVNGSIDLLLIARDVDPDVADAAADRLLNATCNALNGQSLAGLTFPSFTMISGSAWGKRTPPESRITAHLTYRYLTESWSGFNADD